MKTTEQNVVELKEELEQEENRRWYQFSNTWKESGLDDLGLTLDQKIHLANWLAGAFWRGHYGCDSSKLDKLHDGTWNWAYIVKKHPEFLEKRRQ